MAFYNRIEPNSIGIHEQISAPKGGFCAPYSYIPLRDTIPKVAFVRDRRLWPGSMDPPPRAPISTRVCKYHPMDGRRRCLS